MPVGGWDARKIRRLTEDRGSGGAAGSDSILQWVSPVRRGDRTLSQLAVSRLQGDLSAREQGLDHDHVKVLAQCPDLLPPIVVHKKSLRVIDGLHRLRVAELRGQDEIDVTLFDGSEEEAFALGVLLNVRHGLPLPLGDRKAGATRILLTNPDWSDRFVASLVGLSRKTISNIRRSSTGDGCQLNERIGRDGRARPIDPVGGRRRAAEVLAENPELSLRELARAAGISVSTARDVRLRLGNGDDPVPNGLRRSVSSPPADGGEGSTRPQLLPDEDRHAGDDAVSSALGSRKRWEASSGGEFKTASFDLSLERLMKDPAIRFNEAGRGLVRQLAAAHLAVTRCQQALPFAPAHCLATVAELAQIQAKAWLELVALADAAAEMKRAL